MGRIAAVVLSVLMSLASATSAHAALLEVETTGVGASVQIAPPGVMQRCTFLSCTYAYRAGTNVSITATPSEAGSALATWRGACSGAAQTCEVRLGTAKRVVVARFSPVRLYSDRQLGQGGLAVTPAGAPCGTGCQAYPYNTALSLTATPAAGWVFVRWLGFCRTVTTAPVCAATIIGDSVPFPEFDCGPEVAGCAQGGVFKPRVRATVSVGGGGSVIVNNRLRCSGQCGYRVDRGRLFSLRADNRRARFLEWRGRGCTGTALRCQFTAHKAAGGESPAVIARFG